jgi:hypothetical protein
MVYGPKAALFCTSPVIYAFPDLSVVIQEPLSTFFRWFSL